MIFQASQRGGSKQLGQHLLRTDDNEHVEIHEVRGFVSDDLPGAMDEAYAVSRGTRCKQFLFSVSLNPPQNASVDIDTFEDAAKRIEDKLGLSGQPRVIVFHEKEGRRHAHAVWSRIDAENMRAVNLSHYKLKLRDISRELYLENGWDMPKGLRDPKDRDTRNHDFVEYQQAKRTDRSAKDLKAVVQQCWERSDSRAAFAGALKENGLILVKGDRRGHVAVTREGEALSIARYAGVKTKEVRAKLGEPDGLPSIEDAKDQHAKAADTARNQERQRAKNQHRREMAALNARREDMTRKHRAERRKLDAGQKDRRERETRARSDRLNKGLKGLWQRMTGQHARIRKENEQQAFEALKRDTRQRQNLIDAQRTERQKLQREITASRSRYAERLRHIPATKNRNAIGAGRQRSTSRLQDTFRQVTLNERLNRNRTVQKTTRKPPGPER